MADRSTRILEMLREGAPGFVSGDEIGRRLGLTRAAVWKRVRDLRAEGYRIEARRSEGYRLEAEGGPFHAEAIRRATRVHPVGADIHYFPELDSTNARARELAAEGARGGTCVIADRQTAGRGRLGRAWLSPPGVNLYLSVILRPEIPPAEAPKLTLAAAVALAEAVEETTALTPEIKWPNDLLLRRKKAAGILTEMEAEMDRVHFVILGVGVNVNATEFPEDIAATATSLRLAAGREVPRAAFTGALLDAVERCSGELERGGFAGLRERWLARAAYRGEPVRIDAGGRTVRGTLADLAEDGALVLRGEDGGEVRVLAGDVRSLRPGDPFAGA